MKKEYVKKYADQGIKIFACNPDKTPKVQTGFYAATTDPEKLEAQFTKETDLIGITTGNMNKLVVIDIDVGKPDCLLNRDELLEKLLEIIPDLSETFTTQTPGDGLHKYFKLKYGTKLSSKRRFFDPNLSIDIRANGGYVCAVDGDGKYIVYDDVDNLNIENFMERCAYLPDSIENFKPTTVYTETGHDDNFPPEEIREIRSALSFLSSDDRDLWVKYGLALKGTKSKAAFGLWNEWSQKSDKYNAAEMEKRWKGFKPTGDITIASIFADAKKAGWVTTYEKKTVNVITTPAVIYERKPFPKELLRPDGLVGDLVDYINFRSIKRQPILSLGGALAAVGALAGRKVQSETGLRTNLYCLNVGASGCGKENVRSTIKQVFHFTGCTQMASIEDLASDASIATTLQEYPSQIFLLDEIGRFLQTTKNSAKNPHLYNIVSVLMRLYGLANQTWKGKAYADKTKQILVEQPNLCLIGTTVPDVLYKGLEIEHITDGFLSRMLMFESEEHNPRKERRKKISGDPPKDLIEQVQALWKKEINVNPMGNLHHLTAMPQTVKMTDDAQEISDNFDDHIESHRDKLYAENKINSIYNRASEMAIKIAMIIAVGINIEEPIITEKEINYAVQLVQFLTDNLNYITENFIAENQYEHDLKKILQIIRKRGRMYQSELTRKTQHLEPRIRNGMIDTLVESGQIAREFEGGEKKSKVVLVSI